MISYFVYDEDSFYSVDRTKGRIADYDNDTRTWHYDKVTVYQLNAFINPINLSANALDLIPDLYLTLKGASTI